VVVILTVLLWPQGKQVKSTPSIAADAFPDRPIQQARFALTSEDKAARSLPAATAEPQPSSDPQPVGPPRRLTESYATCMDFVCNPTQAAQLALQDQKFLFTIHLPGNSEDSHFT